MPNRYRLMRWISAASLLGVVAVTVQGQRQVADDNQLIPPTFRTEANYVRVDVFVTRDGEPVTDLRPEEVQILDEGVLQEITQFEYIRIRGHVPQEARREPNTVAESREMLRDPRARVFVLFLDTRHVDVANSRRISQPLIDSLDALLGVDDLVGVMTSDMSAADVAFARKTISLQRMLEQEWWGERNRLVTTDPVEEQYQICYPPQPGETVSVVAKALIERRREKMTLDALGDLVRFLRGVREERKAILVITEGWRLLRPSRGLFEREPPPRIPPPAFDPGTGRLTIEELTSDPVRRSDCDRDLRALAMADNEQQFRFMLDEANRANASFYPVAPSGLAVFDSPIGPDPLVSLAEDRAQLRARQSSLRTLADRTDGLAIVNTNNITQNLQRAVEDLSSYYLLGYYAAGVKMDGKFHDVRVRVSRPGVAVRARRGYLASSRDEMLADVSAVDSGGGSSPAEAARTRAIERAVGSLAGFARELPLRIQASASWTAAGTATFQVVGNVSRDDEWANGADVDVTLSMSDGETLSTQQVSLQAGTRHFDTTLGPDGPAIPGDYTVRVSARGRTASSLPTSDVVGISLPDAPDGAGVRFFRRGPSTGNREVATADLRFSRRERLRIDVPAQKGAMPSATLLDRTGAELPIPVETSVRDAGDGTGWVTAELVLAPLARGDYVIEISGARPSEGSAETHHIWTAFRVVR